MILGAAGLAWYAAMLTPTSNYYAVMLPAMLAGGIGTGLTFVGCTVTGMRGVAPHDTGVAAGLLAGSIIFAAGAVVALLTINARSSAAEAAGH